VSITGELDRARHLAFGADEAGAKDLLLSLVPHIERADRDDLMLEVFAQLGQVYLVRGANDGVAECIRRIRDCLAAHPTLPANTRTRYARQAQFLQTGLAAAHGDHERAAAALATLDDADAALPDLADEHRYLVTYARILCAAALCEDDLHVRSLPLWDKVIAAVDGDGDGSDEQLARRAEGTESADYLRILAGTGYGRFCVETGRLSEAEPWLRREGARAQARGWELATARTQLELGAAKWVARDHLGTEQLIAQAYPVIARHARADDVSRCWLYFGLTRMGAGALQAADECFEHAERHWRELGKPLHIHRILLQRSWIAIFRGRYPAAVELVAQARDWLDKWPRASWLQYARLDNHLGTIWRAEGLADLGFDAAGDPSESWEEAQERQTAAIGVTRYETGSPQHHRATTKLEQAADLKIPAALAVDAVRYSIADADARMRWATYVSAPMLAGAFAVAWEWENTELVSELVEYHSARGTFSTEPRSAEPPGTEPPAPNVGDWPVAVEEADALISIAAGGSTAAGGVSLTRLGPLPPLRMDPDTPPILRRYRALALQRYGCDVTAAEPAWSTWP
jgi:hypothetical protein